MKKNLSQLKNLGPASQRWLQGVGIETEADLRALGAVDAYRRVKHAFPRQVSLVMLYALAGVIHGCHWNDLPPGLKDKLKAEVGR